MSIQLPILYVDDEESIHTLVKRILEPEHLVQCFSRAEKALEYLKSNPVKLIISDERMPEMSGHDFLALCAERYPDIPRVLVTAYTEPSSLIDAVNKGKIFYYISKPWDANHVRLVVRNAEEFFKARAQISSQLIDLQRKVKELSKLEEAKDLFVNLVAHELKTPITSLMGLWELIELDEKNFNYLKNDVRDSIARLVEITKEILLLLKLESGVAIEWRSFRLFGHIEVSVPKTLDTEYFSRFKARYVKRIIEEKEHFDIELTEPINIRAFEFIGDVMSHHQETGLASLIFQAILKKSGILFQLNQNNTVWRIYKTTIRE